MKLPEIKGILMAVHAKEEVGEKKTIKQIVLIKVIGRTYDDGFGGVKKADDEVFEMAVLNNKVEEKFLKSLIDKKVVVEQAFLNSYPYENEQQEKRHAVNITLTKIKEFK
jgi:hypothetical protein